MLKGIHHITAMTANIKKNIRFYSEILGLRLIKKTVHFESPNTWHLYFGDSVGNPGTVISFLPYPGMPRGQSGVGSTSVIGFSVGAGSLEFWRKRLKEYQVDFRGPFQRLDESYISLHDMDGIELELVANSTDQRQGLETPGISIENAIKGLFHVEMTCSIGDKTAFFLVNVLDHHRLVEENDRIRLYSDKAAPGCFVDLVSRPSLPLFKAGVGTIHHVAFSTPDTETQQILKDKVCKAGIQVSQVTDRQYFKSVFFKEAGGILIEIATLGPGFLVDETADTLGQGLMLPSWLEADRINIEASLLPME
jgi:glyoxalase family protein